MVERDTRGVYRIEQTHAVLFDMLLTMNWRRNSATALILALVWATGSNLIALAARPEACAMTHQACGQTAAVAQCCCHTRDASHRGAPIESRVHFGVDLSLHPVAVAAGMLADVPRTGVRSDRSPTTVPPPDFAARFAPLLI
jgi:hypothetical protein